MGKDILVLIIKKFLTEFT